MGVFGCVNVLLMCQCVRMPRSVYGQDVQTVMCVMLRSAGVWVVALVHFCLKLPVLKNKIEERGFITELLASGLISLYLQLL